MGRFRFSTTLVFLTVALLAFPCTDSSAQDELKATVQEAVLEYLSASDLVDVGSS
jgi:hypothetical protein